MFSFIRIISLPIVDSLLDSPLCVVDTDTLSENLQNISDLPFIQQSMMEWSETDLLNNLDVLNQSELKIKQEDIPKMEDLFPLDNSDSNVLISSVTSSHNVGSISATSDGSCLSRVDSNTMNMDVSDWLDVMMTTSEGMTNANLTHTTDQVQNTTVPDFSNVFHSEKS